MKSKTLVFSIYFSCIFLGIILPFFILNQINEFYLLVINPLSWLFILVLSIFAYKKKESKATKESIIKSTIIVTLMYMIIYYFLGVIFGYLKSPYSHSITGIFKNSISLFLIVIFQEYVRNVLVDNANKNKIKFILITFLFLLVNIEWGSIYKNFETNESIIKFIAIFVIPKLVESGLCTYLVYRDGTLGSVSYRGIVTLFLILVPVLPDINWFLNSIMQIIVPFLIFTYINFESISKNSNLSRKDLKKQKPIGNIILIAILLLVISFIAGFFKYAPISIVSNSMVPVFSRGDSVIIKKIKENEIINLKKGDIIEYKLENRFVIHRIIEIVDEKESIFITKGDNNNAADTKPVKKDQIVGLVKFSIPFIGYPSVYFSELIF